MAEGNQRNVNQMAAEQAEAVLGNAAAARQRVANNMGKLVTSYTLDNVGETPAYSAVPGLINASIKLGDFDTTGNSHFLASEMNLEAAMFDEELGYEERSVKFLGAIISIFHGLADSVLEDMKGAGVTVSTQRVPSTIPLALRRTAEERIPPAKTMAVMGYLIIVLFKSISPENFKLWTARRLKALYAVSSYSKRETDTADIFQDLSHASAFRSVVGQHHGVREKLLDQVLRIKDIRSPMGNVCAYVASILAWTEMSSFLFIHETLLITNSPVIKSPIVRSEVLNLRQAAKAILAEPMPQYFKIRKTAAEAQVIEKNNFPKLVTIARSLKMGTDSTSKQYIGSQISADSQVIKNLIALHNEYLTSYRGPTNIEGMIKHLFHYDEELEG